MNGDTVVFERFGRRMVIVLILLLMPGLGAKAAAFAWQDSVDVVQQREIQEGKEADESKLDSRNGESPLIIFETDFGRDFDMEKWELLGGGWKHLPEAIPPVLSLAVKASNYKPPHRSPTHLALWRQPVEGSFEMTVTAISTHPDYGHRDVCFYIGMQDPSHFYYIHLAKKTDPHANQIFIVNGEDRRAISLETTAGTNWDESPHTIRIVRNVDSGSIEVWFDDSGQPIMRAVDKSFVEPGRIGVGSFDDTADFLSLRIARLMMPESTTKGNGKFPGP